MRPLDGTLSLNLHVRNISINHIIIVTVCVAGKRSIPIFLPPTFGGETTSSATVLWEAFDNVPIYSLSLNGVERYRGIDSNFTLENLEPGTAYFSQVRGISRSAVGAESDPSVFLTAGGESTVIPSPPEV